MLRYAVIALILLIGSVVACAKSAGTTGFELLRMDGSAKSSALGGSQIAVGGGLHSMHSNPAGLFDIDAPLAAAGYFKHVMDFNSGNLAYARPFTKAGVFGLGITYFDFGKFDRANEFGQKEGEFGASDVLLTLSGATELYPSLSGGISLKYLNSTIDNYSASAIAGDVGLLYHTGFNHWDVGAGIYNVGAATSAFLKEKDDLPLTYKLGLSVPLEHLPVRFSFGGEFLEQEGVRGAGGLELTFSKFVQGRIGYNTIGIDQRVGLDRDALAGFSAGLGLHLKNLTFDYALTSAGEIGFLNRFTLSTSLPRRDSAH